jgi:hypothetical protein
MYSNNPIIMVDPWGDADYYSVSKNDDGDEVIKWIGTNGETDDIKLLVSDVDIIIAVETKTIANEAYNPEINFSGEMFFRVLSEDELKGVEKVKGKMRRNGVEHAAIYYDSKTPPSGNPLKPGINMSKSGTSIWGLTEKEANARQVNPLILKDGTEVTDLTNVSYMIHSHLLDLKFYKMVDNRYTPCDECSLENKSWSDVPTDPDIDWAWDMVNIYKYKGIFLMINQHGDIYYFNENGTRGHIKYDTMKKIIEDGFEERPASADKIKPAEE